MLKKVTKKRFFIVFMTMALLLSSVPGAVFANEEPLPDADVAQQVPVVESPDEEIPPVEEKQPAEEKQPSGDQGQTLGKQEDYTESGINNTNNGNQAVMTTMIAMSGLMLLNKAEDEGDATITVSVNFPGVEGVKIEYYADLYWTTIGSSFSNSASNLSIPANTTHIRASKGGMSYTFDKNDLNASSDNVFNVPVTTITVNGVSSECSLGIVQSDWIYNCSPAIVGVPGANVFNVFDNGGTYEVRVQRTGYSQVSFKGFAAGSTVHLDSGFFYNVPVPDGVTNIRISNANWVDTTVWYANYLGSNVITLMKNGTLANLQYTYNGESYNVPFMLDGTNPFSGSESKTEEFSVTFHLNPPTGAAKTFTDDYKTGDAVPGFEITGWSVPAYGITFAGWNTAKDGSGAWYHSAIKTHGTNYKPVTNFQAGVSDLYAIWQAKVSFSPGGLGYDKWPNTVVDYVIAGTKVTLPNIFTDERFEGWVGQSPAANEGDFVFWGRNTGGTDGNRYAVGDSITVKNSDNASALFMAVWNPNIAYHNNGVSGTQAIISMGPQPWNQAHAIQAPNSVFTGNTDKIMAYNTAKDGSGKWYHWDANNPYGFSTTVTPTREIHYLWAQANVPEKYLGTMNVEVLGFDGEYDAQEHAPIIGDGPSGMTVQYSLDGTNYEATPISRTDVGTTDVWVKLSASGYHDMVAQVALIVTPAELEITVHNFTTLMHVGDALPSPFMTGYTVNESQLKGTDTDAVVAGNPDYVTSYQKGAPMGQYEVSVTGLEADNYTLITTSGLVFVANKEVAGSTQASEPTQNNPVEPQGTVIPEVGTPVSLPNEVLDSPVVPISDSDTPLGTTMGLTTVLPENVEGIMLAPWILLLAIFAISGLFLILAKRRREEEEEEEA